MGLTSLTMLSTDFFTIRSSQLVTTQDVTNWLAVLASGATTYDDSSRDSELRCDPSQVHTLVTIQIVIHSQREISY